MLIVAFDSDQLPYNYLSLCPTKLVVLLRETIADQVGLDVLIMHLLPSCQLLSYIGSCSEGQVA
jgi:hypothetical protein